MPTPVLEDQGNTYRCGAFSIRAWFDGAGYSVANSAAFNKYIGLADSQHGLSFQQVHDFVTELAAEVGATVTWLGDGYLRDFPTFDQAVRDGWCVDVGVWEADIQPGQGYYHYIDIYGTNGSNFQIADSFHRYDGEQGQEPVEKVHQAIQDNWDQVLIGVAFQLIDTVHPAVPADRDSQLVTMLSVIGDKTYQTPPDLAGIQELVQQAKHLLGA